MIGTEVELFLEQMLLDSSVVSWVSLTLYLYVQVDQYYNEECCVDLVESSATLVLK